MKKICLALLVAWAVCGASPRAQSAADTASEIIALERAAMDGWVRGDARPALDAADADITYFHIMTERRVDGRRALESLVEPYRGRSLYDSYEMVEPKVQSAGDTAVLTYILARRNGDAVSRWNATQVYQKKAGTWRVIHTHWSQTNPPIAAPAPAAAPAAPVPLDRAGLVALMRQYLATLPTHDPSGVPLAPGVRLVENTEPTPIGKGLWETATGGPKEFQVYAADPVAGEVGFIGVIEEKNKPTILGARLKVVDGRITEIDHLVIHAGDRPLHRNMSRPRPALLQPLQPSERVPRDSMRQIANSYYDAIVQDDGSVAPFADDCQRRENGGISANDQEQTAEEAKNDDFSVFRKMKCGEQLSTGVMSYITDINRRRLLAVDEETGLVFAFSMFVHDGQPKVMTIKGVPGITERPNKYGAFDLPAAHIFKIRNGKIHEIEAIGYVAAHGIRNGWER